MEQTPDWNPKTEARACKEKLTAWLGSDRKDFKAATEFLNKLAERLSVSAKRSVEVGFSLPDPHFGALTLIELAIIHNQVAFFEAMSKFHQYQPIKLANIYEFSLEMLSALHKFNNGDFEEILKKHHISASKKATEYELSIKKPHPLIQASAAGLMDAFKYFHNRYPYLVNELTGLYYYTDQRTVLETAALYNQVEMCQYIMGLKDFELANHQSPLGNAFHIAARMGHVEVARVLLSHDTYSQLQFDSDPSGYTALSLAVLHGHKDVVELLLNNRADVNSFQLVALAKPAQYRNVTDVSHMEDILLMLVEHDTSQEGFTNAQLAYIDELKQRRDQNSNTDKATENILPNVPSEIWSVIFGKLYHSSLKAISMVSKDFNTLVDRALWSDMRLTITEKWMKNPDTSPFEPVVHRLKQVLSLTITCDIHVKDSFVFHSMFEDIVTHCVNLQELDLDKFGGQVTISFMNGLFNNCKHLTSLKINSMVHEYSSQKKHFTKGQKEDMLQDFDRRFPTVSTSLQCLELNISLPFRTASRNYLDFLLRVLKQSPYLKSLRLHSVADISEYFISLMWRNVITPLLDTHTSLKVLRLTGAWGTSELTKEEWTGLYSKLGKLEEFELFFLHEVFDSAESDSEEDNKNIEIDTLNYVAKYCTNLKSFCLNAPYTRLDEDNFPLTALKHLTEFKLLFNDENSSDTSRLLKNMTAACTKLEAIRLKSYDVKARDFDQIQFGPALRQFDYMPVLHSVVPLIQASKTLVKLNIGKVSMDNFNLLLDNCNLLTCLSAKIGKKSVIDFSTVLYKLPHLEKLELIGNFNDSSFRTPALCLTLKKIILESKSDYTSDLAIFYLAEACPNLEKLTYLFGVSYAFAYLLERRLPRLRKLGHNDKTGVASKVVELANRKRRVKIEDFYA